MEKRTCEWVKGRLKGKRTLSTIHFKKLSLGRSARWANEGFSWKPIRHLGFGNETICPSRGTSDSAVKLSAQAVELEKPFRVLICRYWPCVFEEVYWRQLHFLIWEEREHNSLGTSGGIWVFLLCWAHLLFVVVCSSIVAELFLIQFVVASWGRIASCGTSYLIAGRDL